MPTLSAAKRAAYLPYLNDTLAAYGIDSPARAAAFLAQIAHESVELRYWEEIASGEAYEGRRDLGNTQPGDGKRYKGRGPIQITGRANYRKYGAMLGLNLENNPSLAATTPVGFQIAGAYWHSHGLNELADKQDFVTITKRINGGTNGLASRQKYYDVAKRVLGSGGGSASGAPGGSSLSTLGIGTSGLLILAILAGWALTR